MRHILAAIFVLMLLAVPWIMTHPEQASFTFSVIGNIEDRLVAAIVKHNPKSITAIQSRYNDKGDIFRSGQKIKILLVAGHEPDFGGTELGSLKERDMVVDLAHNLESFLKENDRFEVYISRDKQAWNPLFQNYFKTEWDAIIDWKDSHKEEIAHLTRIGEYHPAIPGVIHNSAPTNVALRLFGLSKWANESDMDIVLHIHFNDDSAHPRGQAGKYSGFAIYVPERGYLNSSSTVILARSIFDRLRKYSAVSDFAGEKGGIVESPDLIAIGAYNSVDAPSMLIEYGYIYERQFTNPDLRDKAIRDLAFQTFLGLQDFFDARRANEMARPFDTKVMPYIWSRLDTPEEAPVSDIFALQTALIVDGSYPPSGKTLNDCPRTGTVGACTKSALQSFQTKYGIVGESGRIGPGTAETLNRLSAVKAI